MNIFQPYSSVQPLINTPSPAKAPMQIQAVVRNQEPASARAETAPARLESTASRTEFAVDLGGDATMDGLRALWANLQGNHGQALSGLRPLVSVQEGSTLRRDSWRLAPEISPDVYEAVLIDGAMLTVTFLSDVDRISFTVEVGSQHDFVIQHGDERCLTRIVGVRLVPAAVFDAAYRAAHAGKISVEVPEVYELVNVALALTPAGLADRNLVYHDSAYYRAMVEWFEPWRGHPVVAALDEALARGPGYSRLKMNGYAFEFDCRRYRCNPRCLQSRARDSCRYAS